MDVQSSRISFKMCPSPGEHSMKQTLISDSKITFASVPQRTRRIRRQPEGGWPSQPCQWLSRLLSPPLQNQKWRRSLPHTSRRPRPRLSSPLFPSHSLLLGLERHWSHRLTTTPIRRCLVYMIHTPSI